MKNYSNALRAILTFCILHSAFCILRAQETEPPRKSGVKLMFVPPPMEGTISLGIYDAKGKLVRTLHREADVESGEFGKALNGLITYWDGKNDAGAQMPAAKYFARGYCVGDELRIEGETIFCNDWISDDSSPRIRRVTDLWSTPEGGFGIRAETLDGVKLLVFDAGGKLAENSGGQKNVFVHEGKIFRTGSENIQTEIPLSGVETPVDADSGREGDVWLIDGTKVKQFSSTGEFNRELATAPGDPPPVKIAASQTADGIFLLEQNERLQRVRRLVLVSGSSGGSNNEPAISTWKIAFTKTITFSDTLEAVRDKLKFPNGQPFMAQEKITVQLQRNLMTPDQPASADVGIGIDAKGSFLKTSDGLEFERVSETRNLRWAVLGRPKDSRIVTIFQSDGAVVEQFKVRGLAGMMAFDCGDFDYDPAKDK